MDIGHSLDRSQSQVGPPFVERRNRRRHHLHQGPTLKPENGAWSRRTACSGLDAFVAASAEAMPRILNNAALAPPRKDTDLTATREAPREGRYADGLRRGGWLERDGVLGDGVLAAGVTARDAADVLWMVASTPSTPFSSRPARLDAATLDTLGTTALHQALLAT